MTYEETADELVKRILLIISDHHELLEMDMVRPVGLYKPIK